MELLGTGSHRSASRSTWFTAVGLLALPSVFQTTDGTRYGLQKLGGCALPRNPFCPPVASKLAPVHGGVLSAPATTFAMEENHHSKGEGF